MHCFLVVVRVPMKEPVPTSPHRSPESLYYDLRLFHGYCKLNHTGCRKIIEKYATVTEVCNKCIRAKKQQGRGQGGLRCASAVL